MRCVTFEGLDEYAFYDVRFEEDGSEKEHPLNDPRFKDASILVAGSNFGCGSSREHAPQALYRYGFRAVIAESFAEIFFGNCTTLGVPCAVATTEGMQALAAAVEADPAAEITIDVENARVRCGDRDFPVTISDSAHAALVNGRWDRIGELLKGEEDVKSKAASLGYV
jgi:3-isopropylmalate/(R)-2-methylmalate dehydratase small subunit